MDMIFEEDVMMMAMEIRKRIPDEMFSLPDYAFISLVMTVIDEYVARGGMPLDKMNRILRECADFQLEVNEALGPYPV